MSGSFEEKLQDFLYGKDTMDRRRKLVGTGGSRFRETNEEEHREKVVKAMEDNFTDKLFQLIAGKIAATLKEEGPLDLTGLREKCESVSRLSEDLLQSHLEYAEKEGYVVKLEEQGAVRYGCAVKE